jgi:hypothetical protein
VATSKTGLIITPQVGDLLREVGAIGIPEAEPGALGRYRAGIIVRHIPLHRVKEGLASDKLA